MEERFKDQRVDAASQMARQLAGIQSQVDEIRQELEAADGEKHREARATAAAPKKGSA